MDITVGQVFTNRSGKRFAVAEYARGNAALGDPSGWTFRSIDTGVLLDGRYSEGRVQELVERGSLVPTAERFDVEAAQQPRVDAERAVREGRAGLQQDAAVAGQRLVELLVPEQAGRGGESKPRRK